MCVNRRDESDIRPFQHLLYRLDIIFDIRPNQKTIFIEKNTVMMIENILYFITVHFNVRYSDDFFNIRPCYYTISSRIQCILSGQFHVFQSSHLTADIRPFPHRDIILISGQLKTG